MGQIREKIAQAAGTELPQHLAAFFDAAAPVDLYRINLRKLEHRLGIGVQQLLDIFLRLVSKGLFDLSWEYHCPHCNAIPDFKHNFGDLKTESFCPLCDLSFRNTLDQNVEVTFTAHPTLAVIPEDVRVRAREDMIAAVQNRTLKMPERFLSGLACLNNAVFQELFGEQVLSTEESLQVGTVTFLFTDIKGSTQMYSDLGDAKSYEVVRDHFKILFRSIVEHNGMVVKTIGDAVMGSFLQPVDALKAALRAHEEFKKREWASVGYLQIKMGIHTGNAIVVTLNDSADYFGNTVNLAARIQSSVDDHSIRFSRRVFEDADVLDFLKKNHAVLRKRMESFKGINDAVEVYTFNP